MSEPLYTFPELTEKDLTAVRNVLAAMPDDTLANLATLATETSPLYPLLAAEMAGRKTRQLAGRSFLRTEIRLQWDSGDIKASALSPEFDLCEVMTFLEIDVPPEVGYSQGWIGEPDSDWTYDLRSWYAHRMIDGDDMIYWVRVLDRYMDVFVRGTDHDY